MSKGLLWLSTVVLGLLGQARVCKGQPAFEFFLRGEDTVLASPDSSVPFQLEAWIGSRGLEGEDKGPEAWSMAMVSTECVFEELSIRDTATSHAKSPAVGESFIQTEITPDGKGAIFAVILGMLDPLTLDPENSPHHVLTLKMKGEIPTQGGCKTCMVRFEDGVESSGSPVNNVVAYRLESFTPEALAEKCVHLCDSVCNREAPVPVPEEGAHIAVTLDDCLRESCHRLQLTTDQPVIISLEDQGGVDSGNASALYVKAGEEASPTSFDFVSDKRESANQRVVIPSPSDETYSVFAAANFIAGKKADFVLDVRYANVVLEGISARRGCLGHIVSARITGGGFEDTSLFSLDNVSNEISIPARELRHGSTSQREVVFEIPEGQEAVGEYNLCVRDADALPGSDPLYCLPRAFQVFPDCDESFEVELEGRERYRFGRLYSLTLRYRNTGNFDIPAPLFQVVGPPGTKLSLPGEKDFATTPGSELPPSNVLHVLAVDQEGIAGSLSPGMTGEIPVEFISDSGVGSTGTFEVFHLTPNDSDLIEWAGTRPRGVPEEVWGDLSGAALQEQLGMRWKDYVEQLAETSSRLGWRGTNPASALSAFRLLFRDVLGEPNLAIVGTLYARGSNTPLPDVLIFALQGDAVQSCAQSNSEGFFTLTNLTAGPEYTLRAAGRLLFSQEASYALDGSDLYGVRLEGLPSEEESLDVEDCLSQDTTNLPLETLPPPERFLTHKASLQVEFIRSWDPNEKRGSRGRGRGRFINPRKSIEYAIHFENLATATAPAQRVEIVDELTYSNLDPTTVVFRDVRFADYLIRLDQPELIPLGMRLESPSDVYPFSSRCDWQNPGDQQLDGNPAESVSPFIQSRTDEGFSGSVALRINHVWNNREWPLILEISAEVDFTNEQIRWVFQTMPNLEDPFWTEPAVHGLPLEPYELEPEAGFLLPNTSCEREVDGKMVEISGRGEGYVSYTIKPKLGLRDGYRIKNRAKIIFDNNAVIEAKNSDPEVYVCFEGFPAKAHSELPENGLSDVNPMGLFRWESDCRASVYEFRLWKEDAGPTEPLVELALEENSYRYPEPLDSQATYGWSVMVRNEQGQEPSEAPEAWTFTTAAAPAPCVPAPVAPGLSACLYENPVELRWSAACQPKPNSYAVFLSPAPGEEPTMELERDLAGTAYTVPFDLMAGEYRWSVVGLNDDYPTPESGTWSEVASFKICDPGAPRILSPPPGAICNQNGIQLKWEKADGATSYAIFVRSSRENSLYPQLAFQVDSTQDVTEHEIQETLEAGEYFWEVVALNALHPTSEYGTSSGFASFRILGNGLFRRGDANNDSGVDISDGVAILGFLFLGDASPECMDAADSNDDGDVNITDAIFLLNFLFLGGTEPPAPGSSRCGEDPTDDDSLTCVDYVETCCSVR